MNYHKCLLCPVNIRESEIYCPSCGWEVAATWQNFSQHGERYKADWESMKKRIDEARGKRQ